MAPSLPSSPDMLNPNPNPNPNSNPNSTTLTFSSRPLQKSKDQPASLLTKAKRRRQRALRMFREKQIPALALHCASQCHAAPGFIENPHCFSHRKGGYVNTEAGHFRKEAPSILNSSPEGGAIVIYDGRVPENRILSLARSFSECSGGDGDVSDVGSNRGPDLFELRNWQDGSSSSPCSSTYESPLNLSKVSSQSSHEGPLNVTRAASECSSEEYGALNWSKPNGISVDKKTSEDQLSGEYWKLQADVLAAECKLLRVEKELVMRRWNQEGPNESASYPVEQVLNAIPEPIFKEGGNMDGAFDNASFSRSFAQHWTHESQRKEDLHDASKEPHSKSFTQEALRKLDKIPHRSSCPTVPLEDPTEVLQRRLQGLLLAAQSSALEQGNKMHSIANIKFNDAWDYTDRFGNRKATRETTVNNRCFTQTAASRKQLDFMSLELAETKDAAAYIRKEYRSMLSGEKGLHAERSVDQMFGEEAYCKEAIRQIVAQVQAESEQWSQVQDIVRSLQEEMEVLIETRELLEKRALRAETQLLSLKNMVHHWRYRAQSAEEEVMVLRSERQMLKLRVKNMTEKHVAERRSWYGEGNTASVAFPILETQPTINANGEVEEQPRLANVGTQEDYALCESIVHSRNESSRSSVDLGITSQRRSQTSIKKSLDFSNINNEGSISKSRVRSHRFTDQIRKIEPTRLDFCSKTSDVNNGARHKISGPQPKVELTRLECVEPVCMTDYKERKKARIFAFKENRSMSGPIESYAPFSAEPPLQSSLGHAMNATQSLLEDVILSKSKVSLPLAPTSTPARLPFSEIFNSPSSG